MSSPCHVKLRAHKRQSISLHHRWPMECLLWGYCGDQSQRYGALVQDCSNYSALAMELLQSCTTPSIQGGQVVRSHPSGHINGLVKDCSNSSALAMELLQSCTKPLLQECQVVRYHTSEHFDGLVKDCSNSSALAMELLQSGTKPSICRLVYVDIDLDLIIWVICTAGVRMFAELTGCLLNGRDSAYTPNAMPYIQIGLWESTHGALNTACTVKHS